MKKFFVTSGLMNDEIIIGLMLSDGNLSKLPNIYRNSQFRLTQSIKNSEMIKFTQKYLSEMGFESEIYERKETSCLNLRTKSYPDFTELRRMWYPNEGKKIVPKNIKLTPKSVAWWFMGDGNSSWIKTSNKKVLVQFATNGFDFESILFLKSELEKLGFQYVNIQKRYDMVNQFTIQIGRSSEVEKFMKMIEPYMLYCFRYKIKMPVVRGRQGMSFWKKNSNYKKCLIKECERSGHKQNGLCGKHTKNDLKSEIR